MGLLAAVIFLGCLGSVDVWGKREQRASAEVLDTVEHQHWLVAEIQGRPRAGEAAAASLDHRGADAAHRPSRRVDRPAAGRGLRPRDRGPGLSPRADGWAAGPSGWPPR